MTPLMPLCAKCGRPVPAAVTIFEKDTQSWLTIYACHGENAIISHSLPKGQTLRDWPGGVLFNPKEADEG